MKQIQMTLFVHGSAYLCNTTKETCRYLGWSDKTMTGNHCLLLGVELRKGARGRCLKSYVCPGRKGNEFRGIR